MNIRLLLFACLFLFDSFAASAQKIAFISDAHIQNIEDYPELIRSMEAQVQSTRLFNENYFALLAALDDVAQRNISLVVLPGDLTDNGQFINQEKINQILTDYTKRYGMKFFVTTGNHDPALPFGMEQAGHDFLKADGSRNTLTNRCAGYEQEMACYSRFGFYPQPEYLYWESPFTSYVYENYAYDTAKREGGFENRHYVLCDSLTATDASYLVEPVEGIWLLAIDAGVYLPKTVKNGKLIYQGSSVGYNNVLRHKPFLLSWVRKVASEARRLNKTLITFSHYPLVDFNDGASEQMGKAWGNTKFDFPRVPTEEVGQAFLEAGIRFHIAGHMHVNDTGVLEGKDGSHLYNVQVPSIATYIPAYKIVTAESRQEFTVETVVLDSVPGFDRCFSLYQKEHEADLLRGKTPIWNAEALKAANYQTFCDVQFRDLVRTRFIPKDFPSIVKDSIAVMSGEQLLAYVSGEPSEAKNAAGWNGYDLIVDLCRLRYADRLALRDIPSERLAAYARLFDAVRTSDMSSEVVTRLREIAEIFEHFLHGEPCVNFRIDLEADSITECE